MADFTIEATYRLPIYRHRTYSAETPEEACRLAIDDVDWDDGKEDHECAGETYVTGIWSGADAAYRGESIPILDHFDETVQRKADHFGELLAALENVAQPGGIGQFEFQRWLPKAQAAVAKAKAIIEGRRSPD